MGGPISRAAVVRIRESVNRVIQSRPARPIQIAGGYGPIVIDGGLGRAKAEVEQPGQLVGDHNEQLVGSVPLSDRRPHHWGWITATGVDDEVVFPFPSRPETLSPQQSTVPSGRSAQV